ncbi:MAG TPA: hypothetical protein VF960_01155 [Chloroflexota bacterium]
MRIASKVQAPSTPAPSESSSVLDALRRSLEGAGVPWRETRIDSATGSDVAGAALRRHGIMLALLGPDGAGKSTVAAQIAESFPLPVRRLYMGLWQRPEQFARPEWLPGWSLLRRLLMAWRAYLRGRYYRARGYLVIFDRYCYDALVPAVEKRTPRARLYAWILGHCCPAPDLTVLLDAPGEVMHERKHESNPIALEAQRQGFLSLRQRLPRLHVVDATCAQDTLRDEMIALIWSSYFGDR